MKYGSVVVVIAAALGSELDVLLYRVRLFRVHRIPLNDGCQIDRFG